jgi:hypothetical protein
MLITGEGFARRTKLALGSSCLAVMIASGPFGALLGANDSAWAQKMATTRAGGLTVSAGVG